MHYAADITGAEIMRTLRDEAKNRAEHIKVLEFSPAVELILNEHGHCAGAVLYNLETEEFFVIPTKSRRDLLIPAPEKGTRKVWDGARAVDV